MFNKRDPFGKRKSNNSNTNGFGRDPFKKSDKSDEDRDFFGRKKHNPLDRSNFPDPDRMEQEKAARAAARAERYTVYEPKQLRSRLNVPRKLRKRPEPMNAFLWIDDTAYKVVEFSFGFKRHTDGAGRIVGKMCINPFTVVVKPIKDHGRLMRLAWSNHGTFDGKLEHLKPDGITRIQKDVILHNTQIVGYKDTNWYYEGPAERVVVLKLSPLYMKVQDVVYESTMNPSRPLDWNPPGLLSRERFEEEEREGVLEEFYITNLKGERIDTVTPDTKVILVIRTRDMLRKLISINLSNPTVDFVYKGKLLKEDTLKGYRINSDLEKIELEVICQNG